MRQEHRVARRMGVGPAEGRRRAAARFTQGQFLVPNISDEDILPAVELEIAPSEIRQPLVPSRVAAFKRRVELGLPGSDGDGLGLVGTFVREEEVKTILYDRTAYREAIVVAPIVGFRIAELLMALLLELVQRV